jgi:membrane protease YdiL (CAAX protease family)
MGWRESILLFAIPTVVLYIATHLCIPILYRATNLPLVVCWYVCGGVLVFIPLFVAALIFYRKENNPWRLKVMLERFRMDRFSVKDLLISIGGVLAAGVGTFLMIEIGKKYIHYFSAQPPFLTITPLGPGEFWILLAWLPMFVFNIFGEGLFWRGYIFPRQQEKFGDTTWFYHGLLWMMFHLPFGWQMMFILTPIIFITSYLVQVTRNTWVDIIIHTAINGSGFLLIAFGIVQ